MVNTQQRGAPRRQHTVSQVVLRQFISEGRVSVFDRQKDAFYSKGPAGIFWDDLDQHDPVGAEQRWGAVEKDMPRVYRLIRERNVLDDVSAMNTLRDLLALHWIRTPAFRTAHERAKAAVAARSIADLTARPDVLTAEFKRRTGAMPRKPADLAWMNQQLHRDVLASSKDEWFSGSLTRLFAGAREFAARQQVQVAYSSELDFMIGDAPVITVKANHDGVGFHQGVALGDAVEMSMPIAPENMVGAAQSSALLEMEDSAVQRYNLLQAQSFVRYLGAKRGGRSAQLIRETCGARASYD